MSCVSSASRASISKYLYITYQTCHSTNSIFACTTKEQYTEVLLQKRERHRKLQKAREETQLLEQARRNAARAEQEFTERAVYERQYGRVRPAWNVIFGLKRVDMGS